jgi:RNA polymerase sigma-70 factor, ECF subfamily
MDVELEGRIAGLLDRDDRQTAVVEAIRGYGPEVLGYLFATLRQETAAEEVFAQFSEDLWKTIEKYRRECSMRTWCYKLAWEATKKYLRDPYFRRGIPMTGEWSQLAAAVRDETAPFLRSTMKDKIVRLRERLRPLDQTLLTLRVDRGLSWTEIATVLATPRRPIGEATLRKRWERLKQSLRKLAEADGLIGAED